MIDLQIIAQPPPTFIDFLHKCRAKRSSMTCVTQLILHLSFNKLDQNQYKEGSDISLSLLDLLNNRNVTRSKIYIANRKSKWAIK